MKFKIDENLPTAAAAILRGHGHDALLVLDQFDPGASDTSVAGTVQREQRTLVTLDLDFSDIRMYPPGEYSGIIVLRPRRLHAPAVLRMIEQLVAALESESPDGLLWIVEADRIRVRGESA